MKFFKLLLCSTSVVAHLVVYAQTNDNEIPELAPYIVTANKYPEDPLKLPAFVTVLTQEEIKNSGVRTVNEALMSLGGVLGRKSLYGGNEFTMDLGGFGEAAASNMVYVIDGVAFKHGDASEIRISNISLDEVERIEIQRGGSSVLYGEGAVGGVINIVTHASGLTGKIQNTANAEAGYGSYGFKEIKTSGQFANEGLRLFLSGAKGQSDGFRANSGNHSDNASVAIQWVGDRTRVGTSFSNNNEFAQTPGSLTMAQYLTNRNQADSDNLSNRTLIDSNSKHYGVFSEIDLNGLIWRNDVKRRDRDYYYVDIYNSSSINATIGTTNYTYSSTLSQSIATGWGKNQYIVGLEKNHWSQYRDYSRAFGYFDNTSDSKSAYFKNDFDLSSTLTRISMGYRVEDMNRYSIGYLYDEYYEKHKKMEAWEWGITQTLTPHQSVWTRLSRNYRLPNIDEFSANSATLNPQSSLDKEIGWHFLTNSTQTDLRFYQSNIQNEIAYDATVDGNYGGNVNLDPTKRQGVEASIRHKFSQQFEVSGVANYKKSNFIGGTYSENAIPLSPNTTYSLRGNWKFASAQSVSVIVTYTDAQQIGSDYSNLYSMPSYTVTDLFYQYKTPKWEFQFAVKNAFNKDYYSYATNAYIDYTTRYTALYPDMKRSFFAVYKYYLN
jgi:iron complex outermembrane receptor protein